MLIFKKNNFATYIEHYIQNYKQESNMIKFFEC